VWTRTKGLDRRLPQVTFKVTAPQGRLQLGMPKLNRVCLRPTSSLMPPTYQQVVRAQLLGMYCRRMSREPSVHHLLFDNGTEAASTATASGTTARRRHRDRRRLSRRRLGHSSSRNKTSTSTSHQRSRRLLAKFAEGATPEDAFEEHVQEEEGGEKDGASSPGRALRGKLRFLSPDGGGSGPGGLGGPVAVAAPLRVVVHARRGDRVGTHPVANASADWIESTGGDLKSMAQATMGQAWPTRTQHVAPPKPSQYYATNNKPVLVVVVPVPAF